MMDIKDMKKIYDSKLKSMDEIQAMKLKIVSKMYVEKINPLVEIINNFSNGDKVMKDESTISSVCAILLATDSDVDRCIHLLNEIKDRIIKFEKAVNQFE